MSGSLIPSRRPKLLIKRLVNKFISKSLTGNDLFGILDKLDLPHTRFVFQVGASYGQELSYFKKHGIENCICFEPIPAVFNELKKNADSYNWTAINKALGNERATKKLYCASNQGMSSSLLRPASHTKQFPSISFAESIDIEVDLGSSYVKQYSKIMSDNSYPVLYMDTQGFELEVLKGIGNELNHFSYIYTEVGFGFGYEGAVSINTLCSFLFGHGFEILDLTLTGRNGWGDALFAKRHLISGR